MNKITKDIFYLTSGNFYVFKCRLCHSMEAKKYLLEIGRYGAQKKRNLMLISNKTLFLWKVAPKKVIYKNMKNNNYFRTVFELK